MKKCLSYFNFFGMLATSFAASPKNVTIQDSKKEKFLRFKLYIILAKRHKVGNCFFNKNYSILYVRFLLTMT